MNNLNGCFASQPFATNGIKPDDFAKDFIACIFITIFLAIISTAFYECYCCYSSNQALRSENFSRTYELMNALADFVVGVSFPFMLFAGF